MLKLKSVIISCLEVTDVVFYIVDLFAIKMPCLSLLVYTDVAVIVCTGFTILFTKSFYKCNEYIIDRLFEDDKRIGLDTLTTTPLLCLLKNNNKITPNN